VEQDLKGYNMKPIEAYASATSVSPGDQLDLHVNTEVPGTFRVDVLRRGADDTLVLAGGDFNPADSNGLPADASSNGCQWPVAFSLQVDNNWSSGVYIARLTTADGFSTDVLFVVKAAAPGTNSKILLQLAVNTAQAYNSWGGQSLYGYNSRDMMPATQVSFDRPGIEGHASDEGGSDSPFASFEYNFVRWLEMNGFEVEYCTSIDLHSNPLFLDNYHLLLSVGHDEYWSNAMRNNVEAFIANGGNFAIFGGNICWWQVRFSDDFRTMICYKSKAADPLTGVSDDEVTVNWWDDPVFRPGNTMTGVDFRQGAYWKDGDRPAVDFKVHFPQHWVFYTALDGDTFGGAQKIVGYETDAADLTDHADDAVPRATSTDGTPPNFVCLAIANCQDWQARSGGQSGFATMGLFHNNGTVITVATTDWSHGLSLDGNWNSVDQITQNILRRLSCSCNLAADLVNAGFEQYDANGIPVGWTLEGAGSVGPGDVNIGHTPLEVDALQGETWISQGGFSLEVGNFYAAGCWARAAQPGATLRLQSTASWKDFAVAEHPGDDQWHYLYAVGMPDAAEEAVFPARVKIQVGQGIARFDSVVVEPIAPHP
jgi:hypothetical protein